MNIDLSNSSAIVYHETIAARKPSTSRAFPVNRTASSVAIPTKDCLKHSSRRMSRSFAQCAVEPIEQQIEEELGAWVGRVES